MPWDSPFHPAEELIMAVSLPDARELPDDVLEALRLRAVRGCELGFTEADVADLLGVCRETVSRWWSAYARDGLDALPHDRTGRPTGTGRTLSDEQAEQIRAHLDAHRPEDVGIRPRSWTRPAVQQLIRNAFGIAMPVPDRRVVPAPVGVHGQATAPPRPEARSRGDTTSGSRSRTRPSSGGPRPEGARSTGATRPGRPRISTRRGGTRPRVSRSPWTCPALTSG